MTTRSIDVGVTPDPSCDHLQLVRTVQPSDDGCSACLRAEDGWVHLRVCLSCGQVGCCDSSPNRHAREHAATANHPVVASAEPDEAWAYRFTDDTMLRTTRPANPRRARPGSRDDELDAGGRR